MRVNLLNTRVNLTSARLNKPQNADIEKSVQSFSGLTKTAKSRIFAEPKLLAEINGVKNTDTIGKPPVEFVFALQKSGCAKENTGDEIKKLTGSFKAAAEVLRTAEEHSFDGHDFQALELARMLDEAVANGESSKAEKCFHKLMGMQASYGTFAPVLDKAAAHIDHAFKEAGILPNGGKVNLDFISEGARGYAFRISFLDEDENKVFHDKILKLYRSPLDDISKKLAEIVYKHTNENPKEYFKLCKDNMTEYYTKNVDYLPNFYNLSPKALVDIKVDDYMISVEAFQRGCRGKSVGELYLIYRDFIHQFAANEISHGVCAEANRAAYIEHRVGNLEKYDYIQPWFFDLKTGYSVLEASDDELPSITKKIDLGKYGLYHSDLDFNPGNIVKGRVIDYGGIKPIGT